MDEENSEDIYWVSICGEEKEWVFWSNNLTWNTEHPRISLCFENTVLSWTPLVIFFLLLPRHFFKLYHKPTTGRIGWLSILKIILCIVFIGDCIANIILSAVSVSLHPHLPVVLFAQPVIDIVIMGFLIVVIVLERKKGIYSSGIVFAFWSLITLCTILIVISKSLDQSSKYRFYRLVTAYIKVSISLLQWFLHCFSDFGGKDDGSDAVGERTPLLGNGRGRQSGRKPSPELTASCLARITFTWITGLVLLGYKRPLTEDDLWDLRKVDSSGEIVPRVEKDWRTSEKKAALNRQSTGYSDSSEGSSLPAVNFKQQKRKDKKPKVSLLGVLCRNFKFYALAGVYRVISDSLGFSQPQLLGVLIAFVNNPNELVWHGYLIAFGLFAIGMVRTFFLQQYFYIVYLTGMRLRTATTGLIYRKALRLSSSSRKEKTVGEIVNLMSVDSQRLQDVATYLHWIWMAPLQFVLAIIFLWRELGVSVMAGLGLLILLGPLNGILSYYVRNLQIKQMLLKDERIKMMNEILNGVKVLKMYAWEMSFGDRIAQIRKKEVKILRRAAYLQCITSICWFCAPFLVSLVTFGVYVISSPNHILTAQKAFVSLALFNMLQFPLSMLPGTINMLIQTMVSLRRMNAFLETEELDPTAVEYRAYDDYSQGFLPGLKIRNGTFSWARDEEATLRNINLEVPTGSIIAIVGEVGSGKSSLMNAIVGEMHKLTGNVQVKGSVAFVSQIPWCENSTLKDNILFGKRYSCSKYDSILEACSLKTDLDILPAGDKTEIGEKGINLSGGQKQRVSLARAIYADADVYLLDDPLSAVDAHVGRHIFDQVLSQHTGLLRNKTRILVTHSLSLLPHCDKVVVIRDGQIDTVGSYSELMAKDGPFADFLRSYLREDMSDLIDEDAVEDDDENPELVFQRNLIHTLSSMSESGEYKLLASGRQRRRFMSSTRFPTGIEHEIDTSNNEHRLTVDETAETGSVKLGVMVAYFSAITWGITVPLMLSYLVYTALLVGSNIWLSEWSTANATLPNGDQNIEIRNKYLGVYGILGGLQLLSVVAQNLLIAIGSYNASCGLHSILLKNLLRAPMSFFDTTPIGRILNRFSKDIDTVDINIPITVRVWMSTLSSVIITLVIVSYGAPLFLVALIPLSICYYFIQRFYIMTSRQLKRIDSVRRSPIYAHFQQSILGATTIRTYNKQLEFIERSDMLVDRNQRAWYPNIVSYRWLGIFMESVGNFVILFAGVFAVMYRDTMGPGIAGLTVTYALQITASLSFTVRTTTDMETYIVSVERIKEYSEVEHEASLETNVKPPRSWPDKGVVTFRNYSVRYRAGLDLVLRNICVTVKAGERVGIVGRTGAGKSSLTLALFRILEPAGGTIEIDGIDITRIGLHDLRSRITIIPQDPVLFSGTLRVNLDPYGEASDSSLWRVLEQAGLYRFVSSQSDGLDVVCTEGGENFSVGQRQLVCLARALLRRSRVLVLDEATAAVDLATDEFIQRTIREEFQGCTVLTIAHRLNTIMDYDRIMVLNHGIVREMDAPSKLLENTRSIFHSMAKEAKLI